MLELRPTCEHCNVPLPPSSGEARICSFECTFCARCADDLLAGICPNCGGDFAPRPVRPITNWNDDNYLGAYPASTKIKHRPVNLAEHASLVGKLRSVPPGER